MLFCARGVPKYGKIMAISCKVPHNVHKSTWPDTFEDLKISFKTKVTSLALNKVVCTVPVFPSSRLPVFPSSFPSSHVRDERAAHRLIGKLKGTEK